MADDLKERLLNSFFAQELAADALARITDLEARLAASNEEASRLFMENVGLISRLTEAEAGEDDLAEALGDADTTLMLLGASDCRERIKPALSSYEARRKV